MAYTIQHGNETSFRLRTKNSIKYQNKLTKMMHKINLKRFPSQFSFSQKLKSQQTVFKFVPRLSLHTYMYYMKFRWLNPSRMQHVQFIGIPIQNKTKLTKKKKMKSKHCLSLENHPGSFVRMDLNAWIPNTKYWKRKVAQFFWLSILDAWYTILHEKLFLVIRGPSERKRYSILWKLILFSVFISVCECLRVCAIFHIKCYRSKANKIRDFPLSQTIWPML